MIDAMQVTLSVEEFVTVATLLNLPVPRILDGAGLEELPEESLTLSMQVAARSLVARGLLEVNGQVLEPLPWLGALVHTAARPALVVEATVDDGSGPQRVLTGSSPAIGVEQEFLSNGCCELRAVEPERILDRAIDLVQLEERPMAETPGFRVRLDSLRTAAAKLDEGDRTGAVEELVHGGAPRDAALAYLAASDRRRHVAQVTVLYRTMPGATEGTAITWVDCNELGLWELPVVNEVSPGASAEIRPTSARAILDQIQAGFPAI